LVVEARRSFAHDADWLSLDPASVTADTPVPFDLREVWFQLDAENNETRTSKNDPATAVIAEEGDARNLIPKKFEPYGTGSSTPFKSPDYGIHGNIPGLLRQGLLDPRRSFLQGAAVDPHGSDPLTREFANWLGREKPVSILDFSGVPAEASELAIGVILDLIFEAAIRTPDGSAGIGRPRPVLIVLEEAHRYLGDGSGFVSRQAVNRIAREGRKYGVGLMLVSQRPSELPDTALAQAGTIISLRLGSAADQAKIGAAMPDGTPGLVSALSALRTGEAVVTGEAVGFPSRVMVTAPSPFPSANDPSLKSWREPGTSPDVADAIESWRGTYKEQARND
jgi:hypothetical protein